MLILVVTSELCDTNGFTIFLYISVRWSDFYKYIVFYNKNNGATSILKINHWAK